jgi:surface polysaccharide O-acyltransferase-like enzyme
MIWVDNARILAIFAVIFLHIAAPVVSIANFNSGQWWIGNIFDSLVRWCVPVFVMLSGALLLSEGKNESISLFYKKRITKLLIPLLFWSFFFLGLTYLKGVVENSPPSLLSLCNKLLSGRPYYHMWFLYMIIGLYFFTPFLRIMVRNSSKNELVLFLVALLFMVFVNAAYHEGIQYDQTDILFINWFLFYLPYFILGHVIAESTLKVNILIIVLIFVLSVFFTALGYFIQAKFNGIEKSLYFYDYFSITVIPMSISIMLILKRLNIPIFINQKLTSRLASITLGIYLLHPIIIVLLKYGGIFSPKFNALTSVPLISILVFTVSAMLAWLIHLTPYVKRII